MLNNDILITNLQQYFTQIQTGMKAHKSKHFRVVLQTMVLFKIYAQPYENQLSEVIKLMSTD